MIYEADVSHDEAGDSVSGAVESVVTLVGSVNFPASPGSKKSMGRAEGADRVDCDRFSGELIGVLQAIIGEFSVEKYNVNHRSLSEAKIHGVLRLSRSDIVSYVII